MYKLNAVISEFIKFFAFKINMPILPLLIAFVLILNHGKTLIAFMIKKTHHSNGYVSSSISSVSNSVTSPNASISHRLLASNRDPVRKMQVFVCYMC